ncbi:MAG: dependent oxidoreductase [Clostridiales bacterium]|nr:dependent oxidoreductase [Clostridiales bacterium]
MNRVFNQISKKIQKEIKGEIVCSEWHSSIVLEGIVDSWDEVIAGGKIAANKGYKGVVNKIEVKDLIIPEIRKPSFIDGSLEGRKVDALIIGGGIIGASIARELSKWDISILLVDKEEDIGVHATSRNDGMVHPGIEPKPGSKKAYYNVMGNKLYTKIAEELDIPLGRNGSTILYDISWAKILVPFLKSRARANGIEGMSFLTREEAREFEPNITGKIAGAVHFSTTAAISPYKTAIAYTENAVMNGVEVSLETIVIGMKKEGKKIIEVNTNRGRVYPGVIINAAGIYADKIADMAGDQFFTIHPRKGQLVFLDKKKGALINSVVSKPSLTLIKGNTKGGGIVKTIDGNILVGPDSYEQPYREDYSTDRDNINAILEKHLPTIPGLSQADVITYCAGTRAATYEEDFIIEKSEYIENLVYAAGIQSPGLASAPAIAQDIEKIACFILSKQMDIKLNPDYKPYRRGIPRLKDMSFEERNRLIRSNPDYGVIICRCEEVSKGEILDALNSPIPVKSLDALKRRVRPGMGRCQGGFCTPLTMKIISQHCGVNMLSITKKGDRSNIVIGETKGKLDYNKVGDDVGNL